MTARDDLMRDLWSFNYGAWPDREEAERLVNAFAHELAERIRGSILVTLTTPRMEDIGLGARMAADMIDPEVNDPEVNQ